METPEPFYLIRRINPPDAHIGRTNPIVMFP